MNAPAVAYAGMTHLGINYAAAAANRGYSVVCFDPNAERIAALAAGTLPVLEPGLNELVGRNRDRLRFTADVSELRKVPLVYVAADVPTNDQGESDLSPVRSLFASVNGTLSPDAVLVVLSQVPPGFTRGLDRAPERLFCQVETLVFGRAVECALLPERFIVGAADPKAPLASPLQGFLHAFGCPILTMRYESAELAKISINLCLVGTLSIANTLAELCEKVGADWREIVPSLRLDRRIGAHSYLVPGLGFAGGNLERDLATACRLADESGTSAGVVRAALENSAYRRDWAFRMLHELGLNFASKSVIAVLGLAYKENTHSTKNSAALSLIAALRTAVVQCFDPVVPVSETSVHSKVIGFASALDACAGAHAVAIMTPWPTFRTLEPADIARTMAGRLIIDPYGVLDAEGCRIAGLVYRQLGAPPVPEAG